VKRRFSTRDFGLSLRMAIACGAILAVYTVVAVLLVWALVHAVIVGDVGLGLGAVLALVFVPYLLWQHYRDSAGPILSLTHAKPAPDSDRFVPVAERLAAQADVAPPPDVLLSLSRLPNALAVPTAEKPLIVVTSSLIETLTDPELEAVLAHEVTHLANRDAAVMTFVSGPAFAFSGMWRDGGRGWFAAGMFSPVWLLSVLAMRAVSRYREYTADRGSALLTGAPEQLMSALTKIHGVQPTGDLRGGRAVSALCIRALKWQRVPIFRDHPPLEKRLARLEAMIRAQGKPDGR
jgi:heat shock protein HtpX